MKKKILAILLSALMALSLTACAGNKTTDGNVSDSNITDNGTADGADKTATQEPEETSSALFYDFTTTGLDGKEYTQEIFEGNKLTMVNIWGTFCPACVNEMPNLEKLSREYADKGLVIVGVVNDVYDYMKNQNNEGKVEQAKQIVADTGVSYTNLLPSDSLNAAGMGYVNTFPTTYLLNENGELVSGYVGSRGYDQWAATINSLLAE